MLKNAIFCEVEQDLGREPADGARRAELPRRRGAPRVRGGGRPLAPPQPFKAVAFQGFQQKRILRKAAI